MPRLVGLAYASRLFREIEALKDLTNFSNNGNEVAFGTIGNASAAEGTFRSTGADTFRADLIYDNLDWEVFRHEQ